MSRSHYHTPISGITTCKSEKLDKRFANRKFRHLINTLVKTKEYEGREYYCDRGEDWQDNDLQDKGNLWEYPLLREVSNIWSWGKDGKVWRGWDVFNSWNLNRK